MLICNPKSENKKINVNENENKSSLLFSILTQKRSKWRKVIGKKLR